MSKHRRPPLLRRCTTLALVRLAAHHRERQRRAFYTVTALANITVGPHGWPERNFGYRSGHRLVLVTDPATAHRPLTFTVRATGPADALRQALAICRGTGTGTGTVTGGTSTSTVTDAHGKRWPLSAPRPRTGDVLTLTPWNGTAPASLWALEPGGALRALDSRDVAALPAGALPAATRTA